MGISKTHPFDGNGMSNNMLDMSNNLLLLVCIGKFLLVPGMLCFFPSSLSSLLVETEVCYIKFPHQPSSTEISPLIEKFLHPMRHLELVPTQIIKQ